MARSPRTRPRKALTGGTVPLITLRIASVISGNVLAGQENVGAAMSLNMVAHLRRRDGDLPAAAPRSARWLDPDRLAARPLVAACAVFWCCASYFFGPLAAAFTFTVHNPRLHTFSFAPYGQMFGAAGFGASLRMTLWISR